jgi:hypothetical protein
MLAVIDVSGDVGMKLASGSSRFFTLALVLFQDLLVAQACDRHITTIRKDLGLPVDTEFHFSHASDQFLQAFLKGVAAFDFRYFTCTIDKSRLTGKAWQRKAYFQERAAQLVLELARPKLLNAKVLIDKSADRAFNQAFAKYLKKHAGQKEGQPAIREAKSQSSHKHNLLQVADMVCGAVARTYREEKKDRMVYRNLIEARQEKVQLWPG